MPSSQLHCLANSVANRAPMKSQVTHQNHDTIAMVAIAASGSIAAGTSTNGLT
jgi:isoaspartyl peptidase/L-asparaginase-like protein (Ntn-hydrolase superfamily)